MKTNKPKEVVPTRSVHLDIRFTPEEKEKVLALADRCGLTLSEYGRKRMLGFQPKTRLSEQEAAALVTLNAARGDLVHFKNALSGLSKEDRKQVLFSRDFILKWIEAVTKLINRWNQITATINS